MMEKICFINFIIKYNMIWTLSILLIKFLNDLLFFGLKIMVDMCNDLFEDIFTTIFILSLYFNE